MKFLFDTYVISPHTWPIVREFARLAPWVTVEYCYQSMVVDRNRTTTTLEEAKPLARLVDGASSRYRQMCLDTDFLFEDNRVLDIMLERVADGKATVYMSERWFKPIRIDTLTDQNTALGHGVQITGFIRMLLPFGIKRALKMRKIMDAAQAFYYLPIGIHAARDMARMLGLLHGDLSCLFKAPALTYENRAGGRIFAKNGKDYLYGTDRMRMWGYFVDSPRERANLRPLATQKQIRVLWIGRMVGCKRVDTIIRAVGGVEGMSLSLYGTGPEERRLRHLASQYGNVNFGEAMPLNAVRQKMREHDVFVFASSAFDGWGAVVNEALAEGMMVVGSMEAGASATILPAENLFHVGDWRTLRRILLEGPKRINLDGWHDLDAAKAIRRMIEEMGVRHDT